MKVVVNGRNIEVTPSLRSYAEDKIGKFDRYLSNITEAVVTLSVQKFRHKAEVLIKAGGTLIQAEGVTEELYSSIDEVAQKLERQIKKHKGKLKSHRKAENPEKSALIEEVPSMDSGRIIEEKTMQAKPMAPDEAAAILEESKNEFLVFTNSLSGEMNVIYRLGNGNLGLTAPAR